MGGLLAVGLNQCESRGAFEVVIQPGHDLVAVDIQLAQSVTVLDSKFLRPARPPCNTSVLPSGASCQCPRSSRRILRSS